MDQFSSLPPPWCDTFWCDKSQTFWFLLLCGLESSSKINVKVLLPVNPCTHIADYLFPLWRAPTSPSPKPTLTPYPPTLLIWEKSCVHLSHPASQRCHDIGFFYHQYSLLQGVVLCCGQSLSVLIFAFPFKHFIFMMPLRVVLFLAPQTECNKII